MTYNRLTLASVDDKIAALTDTIEPGVREEMFQVLSTLRIANNLPGALVSISRMIEGRRGLLGQSVTKTCGSLTPFFDEW